MLLQSCKIAPHSCSPKLLSKGTIQNCYRKPRPKEAPQNSNAVARSWLKAGPESCPKLLPKAVPRCCSLKLCPKAVLQRLLPQSCDSTKLLLKAAVQSYCPKAATLQTYTPKRLPKAILQSGSRKLLLKVATKSCSPKVVSESGFLKLLAKATPQSCRSSKQLSINAAAKPQSCSPQLIPTVAPQFPKAVLQSTSAKRLPQSGYAPNLFPKRLHKIAFTKRPPKAEVLQSCRAKLLLKASP